MYTGSQKFNRNATSRGGASGGASKRKSFPPPQHHHRHSTSNNRLSFGGGGGSGSNSRNRTSPSFTTPPPQQTADESFRLVGGEPLSLGAIVRLVPEIVDDIKRLEAQGGAAKIKFDHKHNTHGNVVDVGGKVYRFIWANEKDCDIYEERQGGEDGNGLLVETGYAWRSLTVQRELDESAKKRVKERSKECQETLKSRKAIILDADNPSMKSQMKAAAEKANSWKYKQNKDSQFKKRNNEPTKVAGTTKPVHRPSTTSAKGRHSTSPLPSPQNQYISFASPSAKGSATEIRAVNDPMTTVARAVNTGSPVKILSPRVTSRMHEGVPHRDGQGAGMLDLQHFIITLLKDNSKGMSLKALEKAVGGLSTSSSARRIEPILKKIATYEPPGRYILKPGFELENMKSSPQDSHQKQSVSNHIYGEELAQDSGFAGKSPVDDMNNKLEGESKVVENFDPSPHLTDLFGNDEAPDHNEVQAADSSNSDSDSDSASSDSGANSASQSRSKSPAGSASASSSDSDADSSHSKETSDVEIDIMSDGDKEPKKLLDKEHGLSENNGVQDGYVSEEVDIENDFPGDNEADLATASHGLGILTGNMGIVSYDHEQQQNFGLTDASDEREYDEDKFKHEDPGSILNSKSKSKRVSNVFQTVQNTDNVKRLKGNNLAQSSASDYKGSHILQSPSQTLPDMRNVDHHDSHRLQMSSQPNRYDYVNGNAGAERGYDNHVPEKSNVESLQSGRRPPTRSHITNNADKSAKNPFTSGLDAKDQENILMQGGKDVIEAHEEDGSSNERGNGKFEESPLGHKSSMRPDPLYKHNSARSKKSYDTSTRKHTGLSSEDTRKGNFDKLPKGRMLQRELSDLEVGEFREPMVEESEVGKKLEKVGSFKQSEATLGIDSRNVALKANFSNQPIPDPRNASSPNLRVSRNSHSLPKRKSPEPYGDDTVRPQRSSQSQQLQSRNALVEVESLSNKEEDFNRLEYGDAYANQGTDVEGYGETQRKTYDNAPREDFRQKLESHKGKGNKSRKSKAMGDGGDKGRDVSVGRVSKRKRNDSSSDENASYSKYEKDKPELKGPIKSFSQYKEYVQEFCDKYDSYDSLNKILENYRNEFKKLGSDLESVKGRDTERYYGILAQLRESYRQCGTRHKRLKKIFIVLHEELKDLKQRIKDFAVDYMKD